MCFNATSSFSAWGISVAIAIFLFNRNKNYDRWNASFIAVFTFIQFLEGCLWTTKLDKDNPYNEQLTKLILFFLILQPLTQTWFAYSYNKNSIWILIHLIIFFIILICTSKRIITTNGFETIKGENGHLVWIDKNSNSFLGSQFSAFYLTGLFWPLIYMKDMKWLPLVLVGLITFLYSASQTNCINNKKKNCEFSSHWCFTSVAYAVVALFL